MDFCCERCATEYELDDASVSETGTPVQCGSCGHTFEVRRPADARVHQPPAEHRSPQDVNGKRPASVKDLTIESGGTRGSLPQAAGHEQDTDLLSLGQRRRNTLEATLALRLIIGLAVAAAVSYAGITIQNSRGRKSLSPRGAAPTAIAPIPGAAPQTGLRPLVQPLPTQAEATAPVPGSADEEATAPSRPAKQGAQPRRSHR